MDIGRRAAEMATSRLFLSSPRGSLGSFISLLMVSQGFYHRPDRFRARCGPRAAVSWPSAAPKPAFRIPTPPADSALRYWCFGGVPRAPARLTTCLVVVLNVSQGFPRVAKRLAMLLLGRRGEEREEGSLIRSISCCKMGEMMKNNTAQKARPKRFRDAPARLTACLVVVLNVSQGFPRAAKRLAVLLLACRGRRGRRGVSFARYHAAKWAK